MAAWVKTAAGEGFIELEVVLSPGQTDDDGAATARRLMQHLEIQDEDLIHCAYVDMLGETAP